jgi:type II secretory pathway component GspD/PulD (secretin)
MGTRHLLARGAASVVSMLLVVGLLAGCAHGPIATKRSSSQLTTVPRQTDQANAFELKAISPQQAAMLLTELGLGKVSPVPGHQAIAIAGPASVQQKAGVILEMVDVNEPYAVQILAPISAARDIRSNDRFAEALGGIAIGTFANPPKAKDRPQAIIDIFGQYVVAIVPTRLQQDVLNIAHSHPESRPALQIPETNTYARHETIETDANKPARIPESMQSTSSVDEPNDPTASPMAEQNPSLVETDSTPVPTVSAEPSKPETPTQNRNDAISAPSAQTEPDTVPQDMPRTDDLDRSGSDDANSIGQIGEPNSAPVADARPTAKPVKTTVTYEPALIANGDDTLVLDLPDRMEVIQLLDLAAEYLKLDYMYDPEKIRGQYVSLRLHGKLQGQIRIRELYPLLESVLKFKGFAMTCHKGNLVTIVPVADALEVDPALLDPEGQSLEAGDMVVTRVFDLQYVNTASAMNLLEAMKLSVAASPIAETQTLIVTCYAHRMERIGRLLNMIDRPGRPKQFRYRQLKYTMAGALAAKVERLTAELQTVPVKIAPAEKSSASSPLPLLTSSSSPRLTSPLGSSSAGAGSSDSPDRYTVYLEPDERTNRILMIGHSEQLAIVEEVIDALDVAQHDPRVLKVYHLVHISASDAEAKLEDLSVIGRSEKAAATATAPSVFAAKTGSSGGSGSSDTVMAAPAGQTQVSVLEATNSLLVHATAEQHARIRTVLEHVDIAQEDTRFMRVYDIKYLSAEDVRTKLEELEVLGDKPKAVATSQPQSTPAGDSGRASSAVEGEIQVTVREATNSLLVHATQPQHSRIAEVVEYIDVAQQDHRIMKVYNMDYVDASEVKKKLEEFELIGKQQHGGTASSEPAMRLSSAGRLVASPNDVSTNERPILQEPQVAVLESTNALLVNATEFQHAQISNIVKFVDTQARQEAIPYEIYFLENQDPDVMAEVLGRLIQETTKDKESKIEQRVRKTQDQITIVPDKGTFSLVVYASKKNQDWIAKLIKALDKRRPQVLIDVTLVEIRKTDEFNYDLNVIGSIPNLTQTGGQLGSFLVDADTGKTVVDKLNEPGMPERFIDFQANSGVGSGFYADRHVNALLTAMQTKNYGRVLAKPKILVNDNEKGTIKTADTTYVARTSSVPVNNGASGNQSNLIQTALSYEAYEAGITLNITPHISEGQLLRLEIGLTRTDFGTRTGERPPDLTGSDVNTVVTVPDGSTIILGGMLRLNQTKGGTKVPILGDLPLIGILFRNVANNDTQSKLYVFVRAEIIRPTAVLAGIQGDLERLSHRDRAAFEQAEEEFQNYQNWPGLRPRPTDPNKVLEAR